MSFFDMIIVIVLLKGYIPLKDIIDILIHSAPLTKKTKPTYLFTSTLLVI